MTAKTRKRQARKTRRIVWNGIKRYCEGCKEPLAPDSHRNTKYHPHCKAEVSRKQKLDCWHKNKADYRRTYA